MQILPSVLAAVGSLCLTLALILAWCLVGVRTTGFMKRWFRSYQYLLKAHIDYLMMTGLLFLFFLLFAHFRLTPPPLIVIAMSVGSLVNPAAFLALPIKPDLPQSAGSVFGATVSCGFVVTTIGYGGAAWVIAREVALGAG